MFSAEALPLGGSRHVTPPHPDTDRIVPPVARPEPPVVVVRDPGAMDRSSSSGNDRVPDPNGIRRSLLRDAVFLKLLENVLRGVYRRGQRLRLDDIARDMQVSRTPVREALVPLESLRLVSVQRYVGVVVAPWSVGQMVERLRVARAMIADPAPGCQGVDEPFDAHVLRSCLTEAGRSSSSVPGTCDGAVRSSVPTGSRRSAPCSTRSSPTTSPWRTGSTPSSGGALGCNRSSGLPLRRSEDSSTCARPSSWGWPRTSSRCRTGSARLPEVWRGQRTATSTQSGARTGSAPLDRPRPGRRGGVRRARQKGGRRLVLCRGDGGGDAPGT